MKATGIVRRLDPLGRIVIPKEMRNTMGIDTSSSLELYVDGELIILKKYDVAEDAKSALLHLKNKISMSGEYEENLAIKKKIKELEKML